MEVASSSAGSEIILRFLEKLIKNLLSFYEIQKHKILITSICDCIWLSWTQSTLSHPN